ncbi:MAG: MBL fold metallo-hydrolase, partial [Cyclobacteriaceae bacterium]
MKIKLALLWHLIVLTFQTTAQSYSYNVEKVSDGIYVLKPVISDYRWVTPNIEVIINERSVLVVDSGLLPEAAEEAIKEIKKITEKPIKYLVNTHWHGDHWQGNEAFVNAYPDIQIIASEEGAEGIKRDGMVWANIFYFKNFKLMIESYEEQLKKGKGTDGTKFTQQERKELQEAIVSVKEDLESVKKLKPTPPTLTFSKMMTMQFGDREIQFHYLGKGNTKGDAVLYLPKEKILITGDLVVHPSPYESGAFSLDWVDTSKRLAEFDYATLIPGHGDVQHDTSYLDFLNALFQEILGKVNIAYQQGSYSLEEFQKLANHESVTKALGENPKFAENIKNLSPNFIPACVNRVHRKAHDGR